jgi:hypothetical protein
VLALGGTSYAVVKINGRDIKPRSISASKVKKNTLTGKEINEAKLGKVPLAGMADNAALAANATQSATATNAANADKLGGQAPAAFKLSCPADTTLKLGECFETTQRSAAKFTDATATCGAAGRRVPTFGELDGLRQNGVAVGVPPNNYELSATLSVDGNPMVLAIDPSGARLPVTYTDTRPYRCVALPTNTG